VNFYTAFGTTVIAHYCIIVFLYYYIIISTLTLLEKAEQNSPFSKKK
jgi:hypothetical protein